MNSGNYQVLLVEDDAGMSRVLHVVLNARGKGRFEVQHAQTLKQAQEHLDGSRVDVCLLDLNLPDSAGMATFNAIHAKAPDLPIVILTGSDDEELAMETLQHGVEEYLVKGRENGSSIARALRNAIERKRYQEEKRQLEAMLHQERRLEALGVMASGIAHEINTPLQYIGTNIQFLKRVLVSIEDVLAETERRLGEVTATGAGGEPLARFHETIAGERLKLIRREIPKALHESLEGLNRVKSIIRAMNVFARSAGRQKVMYDVNMAVRDAVNISRHEWKYVANLEMQLDEKLPLIACFPEELCQSLLNVIVNAAHAIGDKIGRGGESQGSGGPVGVITITTAMGDEGAEIRIADSGCGIAEGIRHSIFEPFFTTKEVGRGSGQGLAIVYDVVVRLHGGKVDFVSQLGQGTVFRIVLPANQGGRLSGLPTKASLGEEHPEAVLAT